MVTMTKQQQYRIVCDTEGMFQVEELGQNNGWYKCFTAGIGQVGLERAQEWLVKKSQEE